MTDQSSTSAAERDALADLLCTEFFWDRERDAEDLSDVRAAIARLRAVSERGAGAENGALIARGREIAVRSRKDCLCAVDDDETITALCDALEIAHVRGAAPTAGVLDVLRNLDDKTARNFRDALQAKHRLSFFGALLVGVAKDFAAILADVLVTRTETPTERSDI